MIVQRIVFVVCMLSAVSAFCQPFTLDATVDKEKVWDFGKVKEGAILRHEFTLRNTTDKKFVIVTVRTSCGCVAPRIKKFELLPGESTAVNVVFTTKGYSGMMEHFVDVQASDPNIEQQRFIVKADVH